MAKVIFTITDAQAEYLQLLQRAQGAFKLQARDVRVHSGLVERGMVSGDSTDPRLTERGQLAVKLLEGERA